VVSGARGAAPTVLQFSPEGGIGSRALPGHLTDLTLTLLDTNEAKDLVALDPTAGGYSTSSPTARPCAWRAMTATLPDAQSGDPSDRTSAVDDHVADVLVLNATTKDVAVWTSERA
jgi:hypothetical protein